MNTRADLHKSHNGVVSPLIVKIPQDPISFVAWQQAATHDQECKKNKSSFWSQMSVFQTTNQVLHPSIVIINELFKPASCLWS